MTLRAVIIGLLLGLGIASATYFNDWVIQQTQLVGNLLPISVFGLLVLMLLLVNPLLGREGGFWTFKASELAIMVAVALAVCGWPGSGFGRYFVTNLAMPTNWLRTKPAWQAANVMSYVPGGAWTLGEGHIQNWDDLTSELTQAGQANAVTPAKRVWDWIGDDARRAAQQAVAEKRLSPDQRKAIWKGLNNLIETPSFFDASLFTTDAQRAAMTSLEQQQKQAAAVFASEQTRELAQRVLAYELPTGAEAKLQALVAGKADLTQEQLEKLHRELSELPLPARVRSENEVLHAGLTAWPPDAAEQAKLIVKLSATARKAVKNLLATQPSSALVAAARQLATVPDIIPTVELAAFRRQVQDAKLPTEVESLRAKQDRGLKDYLFDQIQARNRLALVSVLPGHILPPPQGQGVLLLGGRSDPEVVEDLLAGKPTTLAEVPWRAWMPSLLLWGGLALALGLGALCLALVVHPQWSKRELLTYPVAKFMEEVAERAPGRFLPNITDNKLFWIGFAAVAALHTINGLCLWFPNKFFLWIPTTFNFNPLAELFPALTKAPAGWGLFTLRFYLCAVAFAFFLTTEVSFSIGVSLWVWVIFAASIVGAGTAVQGGWAEANNQNMILFGAWLGVTLMVLYTGRRHYWDVAKSALGLPRRAETPAYSVWAARLLVFCLLAAVALLRYAGLDLILAVPLLAIFLVIFIVVARVSAETGLFFIQTGWMPMAIVTALFGIDAIGPTAYIVMAVASFMIVCDPREIILPFLTNGLQIGERTGQARPGRLAWPVGLMVALGLAATIVATIYWQYNKSLSPNDGWAKNTVAQMPFDKLSQQINDLSARGQLESSMQVSGLSRLTHLTPDATALKWGLLGLTLVIVCALARLRLPWWPIHPVIFVFWGTYPCTQFAYSFLAGWAIKISVTKLGGAKGYHNVKPLMIGVIAGELAAGLGWMIAGGVWYYCYGTKPPVYSILPG